MATISEIYRFYITFPDEGEVQVFPVNSSLKWKKKKYKDQCFFRTTLETELCFTGEVFLKMWALEKQPCTCNSLAIRIEKKCCTHDFENYFNGTLSFVDGKWNPERCKVEIKSRTVDEYTCLIDGWKNDRNFLEITERVEVKTLFGEIECQSFNSVNLGGTTNVQTPSGYGWVVTERIDTIFEGDQNGTGSGNQSTQITYCREVSDTEPPDAVGWQMENGKWYRHPPTGELQYNTVNLESNLRIEQTREIVNVQAYNGITLEDFFEFYLGDCYDCIVSNYFNIDPDGTAPNNYEYECAAQEMHDIIVFQTSDIVNADGQNASAGNINQVAGITSFFNFWDCLSKLLKLCMYYDDQNGCLRIEHESYAEGHQKRVIDLTKYSSRLKGTGNYSVDQLDIPQKEILTYKNNVSDGQFKDGVITYNSICSSDADEEKEYKIDCFQNDVARLYSNELYSEDEDVLNSVTLVSTKDGMIQSKVNSSGRVVLNGAFEPESILSKYWLRNRPHCYGEINGEQVKFLSTKKIRKAADIEVKLDCKWYDELNPSQHLAKTYFGECDIESIERNDPSGETKISTIF